MVPETRDAINILHRAQLDVEHGMHQEYWRSVLGRAINRLLYECNRCGGRLRGWQDYYGYDTWLCLGCAEELKEGLMGLSSKGGR